MKYIQYIMGIFCAFSLMIILLITSVEAVAYWTPGYYEKEYTKYQVTDAVDMEMDELLRVTDEMMSYLRGNREDLHVPAQIGGVTREFFNDREIAHMEDVRNLFIGALSIRRICIFIILAFVTILCLTKADMKKTFPKTICIGTGLFFLLAALIAGVISTNFSKYFVVFHEIFFNNDLWILDPATDLLINIVPEPFFVDTATRIGITFGLSVMAVFGLFFTIFWYFFKKTVR